MTCLVDHHQEASFKLNNNKDEEEKLYCKIENYSQDCSKEFDEKMDWKLSHETENLFPE